MFIKEMFISYPRGSQTVGRDLWGSCKSFIRGTRKLKKLTLVGQKKNCEIFVVIKLLLNYFYEWGSCLELTKVVGELA